MTEPQSIDLFYEAADYDTVARLLDQMTPQQLWAIYQLIPGRVHDAEHPPVTVAFDDGVLLTCPHCQATGNDSLIWPHRDGLIWPRVRHTGAVVTV